MINPKTYIEEQENKSYEELLKERDMLLKEIQDFEQDKISDDDILRNPSPEVVYQCNLKYLGELLKLIAKKYNEEKIWGFLKK